jgi:hypothetical protein
VTHIHLGTEIRDRDDDTTNPDSIPLSPHESQWRGQQSTMHIDPNRDKDTPLRGSDEKFGQPVSLPHRVLRLLTARVSTLKEIPCKRTFGAEEPIIVPVQSSKERPIKSNKKETKGVKSVRQSHQTQTDEVGRLRESKT